ncbi:MAG TPA: hypothetical protein GXX33_09805 [Firmicutes bacterium]|nr:hypothetical protein [Bacillota bacterium]
MRKTEVIPVERDETVHGLIRKMRESLSPRIIIYSPGRVPFLRNEINLRLLKYYSEEEEKELVLVVKDRTVKKIAARLGIEVKEKLEADQEEKPETEQGDKLEVYQNHLPIDLEEMTAEAVPVREEEVPLATPPLRGGRLMLALGVAGFSLLAAAFILFRPRLNIIVHPATRDHTFRTVATAGVNFGEREVLQGNLPLAIREKQDELSVSLATTGRKRVGHVAARGTVLFINSGVNPIIVPKGTVVATKAGTKFVTTKPVVVPKKSTRYELGVPTGENYGQAEVEVEAVEKGTVGNVERQMITVIEGHLANTLHVINPQRFTSGEDRLVPVVQEEDLRRAEVEARRQVALRAESVVNELAEEGYLLLPELMTTEIGQFRAEQPVGTESSTLTVKVAYKIAAPLLSKTHLYKWLEHNMYQTLPAGFRPVTNEIACREVKAEGSSEAAKINVLAVAKIRGQIDRDKVMRAVAGKTLAQAKEALLAFPEVGLVEFSGRHEVETVPKQSYQVRLIVPSEK